MDTAFNPCGLDGFAFLEFSAPNPEVLHEQFVRMGFKKNATLDSAAVCSYTQGNIQFIINAAGNNQASAHANTHGAGVCAMGFRVQNVDVAYQYALERGAVAFQDCHHASHELPAIQGIGGSVIFFVDDTHLPFNGKLNSGLTENSANHHLNSIDHLTHNVFRGNMDTWAQFYADIFNFREIRFFNIVGKMTGLTSRALCSPCNKIKIPLNESKDDQSQIEEFLQEFRGEGIQHVALRTPQIYNCVQQLRQNGVTFLDVPDTYYEMINTRIPWHQESLVDLQQHRILIDGEPTPEQGLLLQIFTENVFGPVFFEIIQRQGNEGFGEGNFQALFEAIERDQVKRGFLKDNHAAL